MPQPGHLADPSELVDVDAVLAAYYDRRPDSSVPEQRVAFGTSGHRGTSLAGTFTEAHVLAISEAVCRYREVVAERCWFAARPSGTEDVYKIYAESLHGAEHLEGVIAEARSVVQGAGVAGRERTGPRAE
ncbi:MAG TPA: hypothetical protein VE570_02345 [Thermoleophilaceae bacterium]|jgi:phosphoglucomutase|nr:hypothetical protein [Thermoleophilaceae bacterium]